MILLQRTLTGPSPSGGTGIQALGIPLQAAVYRATAAELSEDNTRQTKESYYKLRRAAAALKDLVISPDTASVSGNMRSYGTY